MFQFKHLYLEATELPSSQGQRRFCAKCQGAIRPFVRGQECAVWVKPSRWPLEFHGEWFLKNDELESEQRCGSRRGSWLFEMGVGIFFDIGRWSSLLWRCKHISSHIHDGYREGTNLFHQPLRNMFFHWLRGFRSQRCQRVRCRRCLWARWWDSAKSVKYRETKRGVWHVSGGLLVGPLRY